MSTSLKINKSVSQVPFSILFDIKDLYIVGESDRRFDRPRGSSQQNVFLVFGGFCCIFGVFSSSFFSQFSWLSARFLGITLNC